MKTYQLIASTVQALHNCNKSNNIEWAQKHNDTLHKLEGKLPSGSGIDCGTKIDKSASNSKKIILTFSFHHMNDGGFYDGWTDHKVIITPSFNGFDIKITGRDRNQIKEYLYDVYSFALNEEVK